MLSNPQQQISTCFWCSNKRKLGPYSCFCKNAVLTSQSAAHMSFMTVPCLPYQQFHVRAVLKLWHASLRYTKQRSWSLLFMHLSIQYIPNKNPKYEDNCSRLWIRRAVWKSLMPRQYTCPRRVCWKIQTRIFLVNKWLILPVEVCLPL